MDMEEGEFDLSDELKDDDEMLSDLGEEGEDENAEFLQDGVDLDLPSEESEREEEKQQDKPEDRQELIKKTIENT